MKSAAVMEAAVVWQWLMFSLVHVACAWMAYIVCYTKKVQYIKESVAAHRHPTTVTDVMFSLIWQLTL